MTRLNDMVLRAVVCLVIGMWLNCAASSAQQKKGDVEILVSSTAGLTASWSSEASTDLSGSGSFSSDFRSQEFFVSGGAGYFLTRRHELGGSVNLFVAHFSACTSSFSNGQITGKSCGSDTTTSFGLSGFYRYYFAKEGAKGFPFVGVEVAANDLVHRDFTGNVNLNPVAGYRRFLTRNVALDFSAGYSIGLNKVSTPGFNESRPQAFSARAGLAFVF
jgi:hypothetical protein